MNLPDEKREALAEGVCSAICEGMAPAGIPGAENPRHRIAACYEHQRAADALAPLLAGWLAEARLGGVEYGDARARKRVEAAVDRLDGSLGGIVAERYSIAVREALKTAQKPPQEPRTHPAAGAEVSDV